MVPWVNPNVITSSQACSPQDSETVKQTFWNWRAISLSRLLGGMQKCTRYHDIELITTALELKHKIDKKPPAINIISCSFLINADLFILYLHTYINFELAFNIWEIVASLGHHKELLYYVEFHLLKLYDGR